jgi:arylmalonate decarboxylase
MATKAHNSRREFLKAGSVAAAYAAIGGFKTVRAAGDPILGMIFPPLNYPVPPEATRLYPAGVKFLSRGVGLEGMTPDGYDKAIPKVLPAALELAREGANAISVMGTSLTFYKGRAFNEELKAEIAKATGLPTTTMSTGIIEGLRAANARRVAVATAYTDEVTRRLRVFLEEWGFDVTASKGLGYVRIPPGAVTQDGLFKFSAEVYDSGPKADALLISCGALKTIDLVVPLEKQCKVPVVSSTPHALWNGVRLLGLSGRVEGFGTVLARG